jgi:hypothetical protein
MATIGEFIRESLVKLEVGDTVNFPLVQKSSLFQQTMDLATFHGIWFKTKVDKTRNEVEVRRVK